MKKNVAFLCIACLVFLSIACAPVQQTQSPMPTPVPETEPRAEPQVNPAPKLQTKQEISPDVSNLLNKSTKIRSISYRYKGPETADFLYDFYVKDQRIKYSPVKGTKYFEEQDSYNYIFIDRAEKTAQSYCLDVCTYPGKKNDLNYDASYILTVFDWIDGFAKAEKVGEEVIDDRSTWKLDTSKGILWVDTFYGIPLKAESNGKVYRFQQISVNSVTDEDVTP